MYWCADRETYIRNLGGNPLARRVKMNDLKHNMDIHCLPAPTEKDYQRLERYKREYEYLSGIRWKASSAYLTGNVNALPK